MDIIVEKKLERLGLAVLAAMKRSEEITMQYCKIRCGRSWWQSPYFGGLDKGIVKSIWRHYVK